MLQEGSPTMMIYHCHQIFQHNWQCAKGDRISGSEYDVYSTGLCPI